jgi:hypothetical protein
MSTRFAQELISALKSFDFQFSDLANNNTDHCIIALKSGGQAATAMCDCFSAWSILYHLDNAFGRFNRLVFVGKEEKQALTGTLVMTRTCAVGAEICALK